ncbi:transglutaminase N-terminal domain-containing protein [Cohaesibacter marisflavi]|uniref:transglutaminase N-terminal domain-containing protein n=1 Tax=Cohaesibacter marisflavi TaxID=655353 RepID=UPI0029C867FB|nr:transglutaminase N-terminal domain-containing protein [Cohaesibacter marisflavi]
MVRLKIQHGTTYSYARKIVLGPHRFSLRPRESPDLKLILFDLEIAPQAKRARRKVLSRPCLCCDQRHFHASLTF